MHKNILLFSQYGQRFIVTRVQKNSRLILACFEPTWFNYAPSPPTFLLRPADPSGSGIAGAQPGLAGALGALSSAPRAP